MPRACELCHDAPAAVFRPTIALCRRCHLDIERLESFDNECDNLPTCPDCGACMPRTVCADCWAARLLDGSRKLASRG